MECWCFLGIRKREKPAQVTQVEIVKLLLVLGRQVQGLAR